MNRIIVVALIAVLACTSYGAYVIGNWENQHNSWGQWQDNSVQPNPNFAYSTEIGVTLGNYSLEVTQSGWGQVLAVGLGADAAQAFLDNPIFQITMTVQESDREFISGYSQIAEVVFNAAGAGWQTVASGTPVNFYWWDDYIPERTATLTVDGTAYASQMQWNADWMQIIIALNTGGGAPDKLYFDDARFVPEPATIAMLGLGALALLRKKS